MNPKNDRPLMVDDLEWCAACGKPATSWANSRGGAAVGVCSASCREVVAKQATSRPS